MSVGLPQIFWLDSIKFTILEFEVTGVGLTLGKDSYDGSSGSKGIAHASSFKLFYLFTILIMRWKIKILNWFL